jgi:ribonuclease P protein component
MGRGSIARSRDFRRVFATGTRARRDGLTVWSAAAPDRQAPSRLGLAVRRGSGNAVTRNRIKRRLRAAFAEAAPAPGFDVVARADTELTGKNYQQVRDALRAALTATGVRTSA